VLLLPLPLPPLFLRERRTRSYFFVKSVEEKREELVGIFLSAGSATQFFND